MRRKVAWKPVLRAELSHVNTPFFGFRRVRWPWEIEANLPGLGNPRPPADSASPGGTAGSPWALWKGADRFVSVFDGSQNRVLVCLRRGRGGHHQAPRSDSRGSRV
jgi:hypothetical protein